MQLIANYAQESHLRVLLQGPPGSGKSTLACHFPGVYVADLDINLGGPLRWLRETHGPTPIGYDIIGRSEDGKEIPPKDCYTRLITLLNRALKEPSVETIVIDSATKLGDYIQAEVMRTQGKSEMTLPLWGFYLQTWKQFIGSARQPAQARHPDLPRERREGRDRPDPQILRPGGGPDEVRHRLDVYRCLALRSRRHQRAQP